MKLIMPDNNDSELSDMVERLLKRESKHTIKSIFGKPTSNDKIGSGRANILYGTGIDREAMEERVKTFQARELEYEYSLNSIKPDARDLEKRPYIIEELKWLEKSPITKVTMANYELIKMAQKYCPNVDVTVSFNAGVDTKGKLRRFAKLPNVKAINTDRTTYRNIPLLKELVKEADKYDAKVRLIANLGCMTDCPREEEHRIVKGVVSTIESPEEEYHYGPCTFYCLREQLENPEELLKLPIIRPEDLDVYEQIGIDSIKLVERAQTTEWNEKVIGHYLDGHYEGNILDLTCNFTRVTSKMTNEEFAAIDMDEVMKTRKGVVDYREMLPELMNVSIDNETFNPLTCNNTCNSCDGCSNTSALIYDQERREMVLCQLDKLEDGFLFK